MKPSAALLVIVLLSGCGSLLEPQPDLARYYLLTPSYAPAPSSISNRPAVTVGLLPIRLPGYLDQREIATRIDSNQIEYARLDRWGESLDSNFHAVLVADLSAELGNARVIDYPWFGWNEPDYAVSIVINRFERRSDGVAELSADWTIFDPSSNVAILRGTCLATAPPRGAGVAGSVDALSADVGTLGRQLAEAIRHAMEIHPRPLRAQRAELLPPSANGLR